MHTTLLRRRDTFARSAGTNQNTAKRFSGQMRRNTRPTTWLFSTQPITLLRLADAVHLSPSYLSAVFSAQVGCAFVPYLTRLRIEKAQQRLIATDDSVTEIALDCGFGSFSSFSRAFRRFTGRSAGEFRAAWR